MTLRIAKTQAEQYHEFQQLIRQIKNELVGADGNSGWRSTLAANNVPWTDFVRVQASLSWALTQMDAAAAVPGMEQYAKDQEGDQAYNVAADYTAMRTAVLAIRDWIYTNMPRSGNFVATQQLAQDGTLTDAIYTPAQTAGLRTLIDNFKATVD
jgi:hypothetical protein